MRSFPKRFFSFVYVSFAHATNKQQPRPSSRTPKPLPARSLSQARTESRFQKGPWTKCPLQRAVIGVSTRQLHQKSTQDHRQYACLPHGACRPPWYVESITKSQDPGPRLSLTSSPPHLLTSLSPASSSGGHESEYKLVGEQGLVVVLLAAGLGGVVGRVELCGPGDGVDGGAYFARFGDVLPVSLD